MNDEVELAQFKDDFKKSDFYEKVTIFLRICFNLELSMYIPHIPTHTHHTQINVHRHIVLGVYIGM